MQHIKIIKCCVVQCEIVSPHTGRIDKATSYIDSHRKPRSFFLQYRKFESGYFCDHQLFHRCFSGAIRHCCIQIFLSLTIAFNGLSSCVLCLSYNSFMLTQGTFDYMFFPVFINLHILSAERLLWVQEQQRRKERKNRDEFRKLLTEHRESGILNARLTWKDYIATANVISLPSSVNHTCFSQY